MQADEMLLFSNDSLFSRKHRNIYESIFFTNTLIISDLYLEGTASWCGAFQSVWPYKGFGFFGLFVCFNVTDLNHYVLPK